MDDVETLSRLGDSRKKIEAELSKVIIGQHKVIEQLLTCLLSNGHCLLVGVPGLAKTLLISTLAQILDLSFNRVQFTPDLMPSDITGSEILEEDKTTGSRAFRFVKGPIFSNIVLADEINRTPPKTQAALLQSMQEHAVTIAGETYDLPKPFFVLATENPIEMEGTYPLPEAQLDRFMFFIKIGYPTMDEEHKIVTATTGVQATEINKAITAQEIEDYQQLVRRIPATETVIKYAVDIVRRTRPNEPDAPDFIKNFLTWGAGPRASQFLMLGAKAHAALDGRATPAIEDVKAMALPVLQHRFILNFNAEAEGVKAEDIVSRLLA